MTSPFSIDPLDNIKVRNIEENLSSDDDSIAALISNVDDNIQNIRDVQSKGITLTETPESTAMNEYVNSISGDVFKLSDSIKNIPSIVSEQYNLTSFNLSSINKRIDNLQDSLANLKSSIEKRGAVNRIFISGNLVSRVSVDDKFAYSSPKALIDFTAGSISLQPVSSSVLSDSLFSVLKSNKGLERNVEVEDPYDFFYEGRYYGYSDRALPEGGEHDFVLKTNPSRLKSNKASPEQMDLIRANVFDDDPDTFWISEYVQDSSRIDTSPLIVRVMIDTKKVSTISSINLSPYLVDPGDILDVISVSAGADSSSLSPLIVFSNILTEDSNNIADKPAGSSGAYGSSYSNEISLTFSPIEARYIVLELSQSNVSVTPYPLVKLPISRQSPTSSETQSLSLDYLQSLAMSSKFGKDIDSDKMIADLFNLGGGWSIRPSVSNTIKTNRSHQAIGISEIRISSSVYFNESQFVSSPYSMNNVKVKSISLSVDEIVPDIFPEGDWVKYFISFGDDKFHQIASLNSGRRSDKVPSVLKAPIDTPSITFMAILRRPDDLSSLSPIIKGYKIEVEVE